MLKYSLTIINLVIKMYGYDLAVHVDSLKKNLKEHGVSYLDNLPEYEQHKVNKSLVLMMTYEDHSSLSELLGEPASDLDILCDVNFSPELALSIYQNIGVPHFISGRSTRESLPTDQYPEQDIFQSAPDTELFSFAQNHQFDAIISCDCVLGDDDDLCVIAKNAFNARADDDSSPFPAIIILPTPDFKATQAQKEFMKREGENIVTEVRAQNQPYINLTRNRTEKQAPWSEPGTWLENYLKTKEASHEPD